MHVRLRAKLQIAIQQWLDDNADDIGGIHGIYQDHTGADETAMVMTAGAEAVLDGMIHQRLLIERIES